MRKKCIIILAAAAGLLLWGCETKDAGAATETPAVPVKAAVPTVKDITVYIDSIGTLAPSVLMEVRPQIDGTIAEVLTSEGQWIVPGSVLFKIDEKQYANKLQEAAAQLAIDQVNLQAAQKKLARIRPLVQKDLISQTEWDEQEAEAEKAQAAVALDEARLQSSKLEVEHCTIASPCAGRVGKLDVHPGMLVAKGQQAPLATISQMDPLLVEFTLTEKEYPKMPKESLPIEVKPICAAGVCKTGAITFLDNHFDASAGLILVRGKVQNPDHSLRPGQSVQVRILVALSPKAILIPQKAIRYNQQGPYIYVVQPDQTVAIRQLILGDEQGTDQVVLEGIDPTEQLIIDGHLRVSPGIKVEVKS